MRDIAIGLSWLTSSQFIHFHREAGFYKLKILQNPPNICRIAAHATAPGQLLCPILSFHDLIQMNGIRKMVSPVTCFKLITFGHVLSVLTTRPRFLAWLKIINFFYWKHSSTMIHLAISPLMPVLILILLFISSSSSEKNEEKFHRVRLRYTRSSNNKIGKTLFLNMTQNIAVTN